MYDSAQLFSSFAVFGALVVLCPPAMSATYKYTTISNSASPSDYVIPYAINDSNVVVGVDDSVTNKGAGFVWQGGSLAISSNVAFFNGVNDNGIAAGASGIQRAEGIVLYDIPAGTYQSYKLALSGGIDHLALNLAGLVVGDAGAISLKAFLFNNGKLTHLHPNKIKNCGASAINDNGDIVGSCNNNEFGYFYSGGKYTILNVPNATGTAASFITNDGVIGGAALIGSNDIGFTYSGGVYTTYTPNLPHYAGGGELAGAFANGNLVGDYYDTAGATHGYLYNASENKYYQLDYPGAIYTGVMALSGAGSFVGIYQTTVNGPVLGFIATCKAKDGCNQ